MPPPPILDTIVEAPLNTPRKSAKYGVGEPHGHYLKTKLVQPEER